MIKVVAPALRHPANRGLAEFHNYWGESHGPLFANTGVLRRYVQHLTLPDAYGVDPAPTFDGVSMFWYDDYESQQLRSCPSDMIELFHAVLGVTLEADEEATKDPAVARDLALLKAVLEDDSQLFDRSITWPMAHKRACVAARERVILDGPTGPDMVKGIFIASKLPGLTLEEFHERWQHHHGPMGAAVPGVRRYVQNHAIPAAYADRLQTHDGWSEMWFDDLGALHDAVNSPQYKALREDGAQLFTYPLGIGVARERIQKDLDWTYNDWGVDAMSEEDVAARLRELGYDRLAADPAAARAIKAAAASRSLAVWTSEHLVTFDESRIDARPGQ